ncbi:carbohydrate porin [Pseudomonas eucalypticola]|uniref:Uncharacterized protein n=1 Tax=Pseudomonas eucalypticola TaxID=2599595 RepID=A0A7D5D863_9PSED|nr:carbohydrate porin [Pseudomonas eucalypticola]QKZ04241.1 hypothetical protein HWQ56_10775 [Pseudomonas eucalypticola]
MDKGVDIQLNHFVLSAGGLSGGYAGHNTGRYKDQWVAGLSLDLEKFLGRNDATTQEQLIDRNGRGLDQDVMDDPRASFFTEFQKVNGRGNVPRISDALVRKGGLRREVQREGRPVYCRGRLRILTQR